MIIKFLCQNMEDKYPQYSCAAANNLHGRISQLNGSKIIHQYLNTSGEHQVNTNDRIQCIKIAIMTSHIFY